MQKNKTEQNNLQNIFTKEVDFNYFYKTWYKKIPKILAIVCAIPFFIFSLVALILYCSYPNYYENFIYYVFASIVVGVLLAVAAYFFSAVSLSQKIIVVNELKKINKKISNLESNSDEEDDLPQI